MADSRKTRPVYVVGAGLAGTECALQLAAKGHEVVLIEMRPNTMTPAHKTQNCAELVCSNSLGSLLEPSAPAQLKWEMTSVGSFVLAAAMQNRVPAGQALGVDRENFSQSLTDLVNKNPKIKRVAQVVRSLDDIPRPAVIATGPLTHDDLATDMQEHFGDRFMYFYDAIAPVILTDSIDMNICFKASRYDKGEADYINCPMTKEEYFAFVDAVAKSERVLPKQFESTPYFESCLPVEVMVDRGPLTLAFGPCKPRGLTDPRTGREPFAAVQLRQENKFGTAYNMVGFQTKMTYPEQKRIFRMIPGLANAEFTKLGSLHRNLYLQTPHVLTSTLASRKDPELFFAGQITGVEGYFESTTTGWLVAGFVDAWLNDRPAPIPPVESAIGSLLAAITEKKDRLEPTNINWGLFPPIEIRQRDQKRLALIQRAQDVFLSWKNSLGQSI